MPGPPTGAPPGQDERLEAAQALVRSYCGWHITPEVTETLTLDGEGGPTLVLPSLHVTDIASITEDGTLLDPTSYAWSQTGYVQRVAAYGSFTGSTTYYSSACGGWWSTLPRSVAVELTHGYDEWPAEVSYFIDMLTDRLKDSPGLLSKAIGPFSETYGADDAFGAVGRSVLSPYALPFRP